MDLRGTVVVVTGASSGIGEAAALRFARSGARLVLGARRVDRLDALAERIHRHGGDALATACDVGVREDLVALHEATMVAFGRCDVLVNNAGIPGAGPFRDHRAEDIERIVRVNLLSVLLGTEVFLPTMRRQRSGHVVNVASLAGRFAVPGSAVYSATKHAVVAFSESLYHEVRHEGVLVTTVNPGLTRTEGFPMIGVPRWLVMDADRVARTIVDVVRRDRAPEVSVPRSIAALQLGRVLAPPVYRQAVGFLTRPFTRR